jgi:hypothetical protein
MISDFKPGHPTHLPRVADTNSPRLMDAAGECLLYYDGEKRRKGGGIIESQPSC